MTEPTILNERYQLDERLGTGGMALVYRAHDLMLERDVAVKILREDFSEDAEFKERFRQEARAAANLTHPNIVTVHDFGLEAGRPFIVMEYVPGDHLKNLLQRRGRFNVDETVSLMIQACAGVGYAHRAGLVHCDIKPHNFLITPDNRLKVADFGIARALASIQPEEKSEIVWGSPQYFSPEQAAGGAPSPASDVYSLGVVAYEMLTGRLPFRAESSTELSRMHREDPPPSPRQFNPRIPPSLEQIILKVLSKEPSSRYRTADQLGRVLVTFTRQSTAATTVTNTELPRAPKYRPGSPLPNQSPKPGTQWTPPTGLPPAYDAHRADPMYSQQPDPGSDPNPLELDWLTIILGLLALIAVGGLIPFYLWVYFLYR
jgi:serine/threonine protein kinase